MTRKRKARKTYNARDTEEGRAAHAAEEAERRKRLREKKRRGASGGQRPAARGSRDTLVAACETTAEPSLAGGASAPETLESGSGTGAMVRMIGNTGPAVRPGAGPTDAAERVSLRVGDHRCFDGTNDVALVKTAADQTAAEARNVTLFSSNRPSALEEAHFEEHAPEPEGHTIEWVLVAWPELLEAAREREGRQATCSFCGRSGRIVRVVSLDEWRRRLRYGFG